MTRMAATAELCDVFITHAWRYHEDWTEMGKLLDGAEDFAWRNFSVPWHDPALVPSSETGARLIRQWLETQIIPVHCVIFLYGVYAARSARRWLDLELEMARAHGKHVIGVPPLGEEPGNIERPELVDEVAAWDGAALAGRLRHLLAEASA